MTGLDINTPRGQMSLAQERRAIELFEWKYPAYRYCGTPKTSAATVDAVIVNRDTGLVLAVGETKGRDASIETLRGAFRSEWLVTFDKLLGCQSVADAIQVPFIGLLYLVPSDVLMIRRIYCPRLGWSRFRVEHTETRATINGGTALRSNAFINMDDATVIDMNEAAA